MPSPRLPLCAPVNINPARPPACLAPPRGAYLLQLLCDYAERYAAMLDGRHLDLNMAQQLSGGARVRAVFTEQFLPALTRLDPARDLTDAEVSTVIRNGAGVSGSLMVPQVGWWGLAGKLGPGHDGVLERQ
jgi:hypothetical protein